MTNVFKLAVKGVRVEGANSKELIIDSSQPNPKISVRANPPHVGNIFLNWQSNNISLASGNTFNLYSFPHGFDYVPTVFGLYNFNNGTRILNATMPFQYGALGIVLLDADRVNINLKYFSIDSGIPHLTIPPFQMTIKYYVLVEPGQ